MDSDFLRLCVNTRLYKIAIAQKLTICANYRLCHFENVNLPKIQKKYWLELSHADQIYWKVYFLRMCVDMSFSKCHNSKNNDFHEFFILAPSFLKSICPKKFQYLSTWTDSKHISFLLFKRRETNHLIFNLKQLYHFSIRNNKMKTNYSYSPYYF